MEFSTLFMVHAHVEQQASRGDPLGLSSSSVMPSFLCRQPMQCFLREHLCFSPNMPLPRGECSIVRDEIWSINPHQLTETDVSASGRY